MNLIILTESDRTGDTTCRLTDHRAGHIRLILKAAVGDTVEIGLLDGPVGTARITTLDPDQVVLDIVDLHDTPPPVPTIDLILALPRPQTLKKVLLTSAMMGVRRLFLVRANRVEKSYFHSPLLEPANYTPFLMEGLAQGKLTRLPEVSIHDRFRVFFEDTLANLYRDINRPDSTAPLRLLPDLDTDRDLSTVYDGTSPHLLIAVGPEGGWVPFEIETMQSLGFKRFTLGRSTLRVEHAVTATLAQLELLHHR